MTIISEQIAKRIKGPMQETEDWWDLCYDTEAKRFFILHRWDHVALNGLNQNAGSEEHDADSWNGQGASEIPSAKTRLLDIASAG